MNRSARLEKAGALVLIATLLVVSVSSVVAGAARSSRPEVALSVRPGDAHAAANLSVRLQPDTGSDAPDGALEATANYALLRDPTTARAMRALAIKQGLDGDSQGAFERLSFAEQLTRRDPSAQIWFVNYHVTRANWDEAFRHIDIASSISRDATAVLFPVLAASLSGPDAVEPITQMLSRKPWWGDSLLAAIIEGSPSLENATQIFLALNAAGHPPRPDLAARLVERAESAGRPDLAEQVAPLAEGN